MSVRKRSYTIPIPTSAKILRRTDGKYAKFKRKGGEVTAKLTEKGDRCTLKSKKWHIKFEDRSGHPRNIEAFTNKESSEKLDKMIVRLIEQSDLNAEDRTYLANLNPTIRNELVNYSLLDKPKTQKNMALNLLLAEYEKWLRETRFRHGFQRTEQACQVAVTRIGKIVEHCNFKNWNDIKASEIEKYLSTLVIEPETYNGYVGMFISFCQWVVDSDYEEKSPVAGKKLKRLDEPRKETKRALTPDEVDRLLEATENAPYRFGASGHDRAVVYLIDTETGIRAGALLKLTVGDFDLENSKLNVRPEINKNRTRHTIYLKQKRAKQLKEYFRGKLPGVRAFRVSDKTRTADMIKADLEAAGIPFIDSLGRKACFHSLRYTANTEIQEITKDELLTKIIMGHKIPKADMTAKYLTVEPERIRKIIEQLPDYRWPQRQAAVMTGTDASAVGDIASNTKILRKSCSGKTVTNNFVGKRRTLNSDSNSETPLEENNQDKHCVLPVTNNTEKPAKQAQKQGKSENAEKILPESCFLDPDLQKVVAAWATLTKPQKEAISQIIQQ